MTTPDQELSASAHPDAADRDIEAPDDDAFQQTISINPADEPIEFHPGPEVDEYDAWEQSVIVEVDDDY